MPRARRLPSRRVRPPARSPCRSARTAAGRRQRRAPSAPRASCAAAAGVRPLVACHSGLERPSVVPALLLDFRFPAYLLPYFSTFLLSYFPTFLVFYFPASSSSRRLMPSSRPFTNFTDSSEL